MVKIKYHLQPRLLFMDNLALLVEKLREEKSLFFELLDKARREAVDVDSLPLVMAAVEALKEYEGALRKTRQGLELQIFNYKLNERFRAELDTP